MAYVRPLPPDSDYSSAWASNLAHEVNRNRVDRTQSESPELDVTGMNYAGIYSFSASYEPNDVVFVDPNATYYDETGAIIPICSGSSATGLPPICAGLFVCTTFVPPYGYDITYLTGSIAPIYASSGQAIVGPFADTFRLYPYNCYWPIYPLIPEEYQTTASLGSVPVQANVTYWMPLAPMMLLMTCDSTGTSGTIYVNAVASGSIFNPAQLPYS